MKKKESISVTLPKKQIEELNEITKETDLKRSLLVQKGVEMFLEAYKHPKDNKQLELPTTFSLTKTL